MNAIADTLRFLGNYVTTNVFRLGYATRLFLLTLLYSGESFRRFRKPYGALIAAKIGGFALLMALAALNKWKLVPSFLDVDGRSSMTLRRTVLIEYGLIIVVLGLTAIMTTFYSPDG